MAVSRGAMKHNSVTINRIALEEIPIALFFSVST